MTLEFSSLFKVDRRHSRLLNIQFFTLACLLLGSCATRFKIDVFPKDATIEALSGGDPKAQGKVLGKGNVEVEADAAVNEVYKLSSPGYETLYVFVPPKQDGLMTVKLNQLNEMQKIIELEGKLNAADRSVKELQNEINRNRNYLSLIARSMANAQRALSRGSAKEAEVALQQIFNQEKGTFIPASAYTLRGKIHLMKSDRAKAIADLKTALQISPDDSEASFLLKNIGN